MEHLNSRDNQLSHMECARHQFDANVRVYSMNRIAVIEIAPLTGKVRPARPGTGGRAARRAAAARVSRTGQQDGAIDRRTPPPAVSSLVENAQAGHCGVRKPMPSVMRAPPWRGSAPNAPPICGRLRGSGRAHGRLIDTRPGRDAAVPAGSGSVRGSSPALPRPPATPAEPAHPPSDRQASPRRRSGHAPSHTPAARYRARWPASARPAAPRCPAP